MKRRNEPRRVFRLPRWGKVLDDVDDELQFHLEMRYEDLVQEGWSEEDARREARRQFGNLPRVREQCRRIGKRREGEMRIADLVGAIRQDVEFALRQFIRSPATSLLAVLTLALGIGATTLVFSVVNAVILEAVPFEEADRLMVVRELTPQGDYFSTSDPNYLDWTERQRSFQSMGAYTLGDMTLTGDGQAERLEGLRITHGLFPTLGIAPLVGRGIAVDEDRPEAGERVVLLSERFWESRFARDEGVLSESLVLDGTAHAIIGVVPSDRGYPGVDIFTPSRFDINRDRSDHMIQAVARLGDGTTANEARLDMIRIAAELSAEYPDTNAGWSATVQSFQEWRVGDRLARIGLFLALAVGLLLLMACSSVSTMLVARATGRQREMGLRAALGAGRKRILGQLLTESAVLGAVGGGLGVLLAWVGTPAIRALGPPDMARLAQASVDGRVLAVALAASLASVLLFGLVPAVFAVRGRLFDSLREGAASVSGGNRRLRDILVTAQFALAIVVVIGAGLMTRSFAEIQRVDLGFDPDGAVQFSLGLPDGAFSAAERLRFLDQLEAQVASLPGVEAVGFTMSTPFSEIQASNFVAPADDVPDRQDDFVATSWRSVSSGYFSATGIRLLAGRTFGPRDAAPADPETQDDFEASVIVDESLARELWGSRDVVDRFLVWSDPGGPTMRVVGVVSTIRDESVEGLPRPRVYLPYSLFPWPTPSVIVRGESDPAALVPSIRGMIRELDADVPMMDVATLPELTRQAVAWPRFTMQIVAAFGLLAVVLAAMGIYGVASFGVQRRRREIGIRMALGAEPDRIVRLVLRGAVRLAFAGIALGVLLALAVSGFLDAILYDVASNDPLTFFSLPIALGLVAVFASWLPARKATRVAPRDALTRE